MSKQKAPHHIVERLAADLFVRTIATRAAEGFGLTEEAAEVVARKAFDAAEIFGEESQRRWAAGDTEAAKAMLEKANGR